MIWATVISQSCFLLTVCSISIFGCKEYNQSDFSIDYLVMSMCRVVPRVAGRGCLLWPVRSLNKILPNRIQQHIKGSYTIISWQNSVSLCPASFRTPRPNLPVTPGVSWLPTFAFHSPMMKRTFFLVLVLEGIVGHNRTVQLQLLQH